MDPTTETERREKYHELVDLLLSIKPEIFSHFDVCRTHYESKGGKIGVDILVPKSPSPKSTKPRPVMVRIHGGFLVSLGSFLPLWHLRVYLGQSWRWSVLDLGSGIC